MHGDIRNVDELDRVFQEHPIEAVIHFAGLKAVGESQEKPIIYFDNNIAGSVQLVKSMEKAGVYTLVFSSSATVYDEANISPLNEEMPTGMPSNNYGYTKLIVEQLLQNCPHLIQNGQSHCSVILIQSVHIKVAVLGKTHRVFQII